MPVSWLDFCQWTFSVNGAAIWAHHGCKIYAFNFNQLDLLIIGDEFTGFMSVCININFIFVNPFWTAKEYECLHQDISQAFGFVHGTTQPLYILQKGSTGCYLISITNFIMWPVPFVAENKDKNSKNAQALAGWKNNTTTLPLSKAICRELVGVSEESTRAL